MDATMQTLLKGHFLIAMPALMDPNFHKTVTCLSEHTDQGAVGIVINTVYPMLTARVVFEELDIPCNEHAQRIPIHIGGPVHANELFVLHGPPLAWKDSFTFADNLAMSNSRDILEAIAMGEGPQHYLIALGCAGWGPGQLEWEISQNAWLTSPCTEDIIFTISMEDRWETAIKRLGIDPDLLTNAAGHA